MKPSSRTQNVAQIRLSKGARLPPGMESRPMVETAEAEPASWCCGIPTMTALYPCPSRDEFDIRMAANDVLRAHAIPVSAPIKTERAPTILRKLVRPDRLSPSRRSDRITLAAALQRCESSSQSQRVPCLKRGTVNQPNSKPGENSSRQRRIHVKRAGHWHSR